MNAIRYEYAGPFRSWERAGDCLNDMWAAGECGPLEVPQIISRKTPKGRRYFVTLLG